MMPDGAVGDATRSVVVVNAKGLHARASARFVALAETFGAEVTVDYGQESVPGQSIMGLMMLGAGKGAEIQLRATGPDASAALDALVALIASGFGEDD
ncbi:HPr family phosphocarrier protein [Acetobacter sp. DsW_063]|uniref:HPr family phosphocarrier protein n=1 Tax=Acetobacter sp. DsW_063 TaxID=1514894 RepID=UPI003512A856